MGVRLVKFDRYGNSNNFSYDHDDLINRDLLNQHPIYAITGLQEVLNLLEDSIKDINQFLLDHIINDLEPRMKQAETDIQILYELIRKNQFDVIDTYSIDLDYDKNAQIVKADLKVYDDEDHDNAIQILADGIYVPSVATVDTPTVVWNKFVSYISLKDMYDTGIRISHHTASWSDNYNPSESAAWYFDTNLNSFVQPINTNTMVGFISQQFFDYYTHRVRLKSSNGDDDIIGLIIGCVHDSDGRSHTLSIIADRETVDNNYALWYDYRLPDQKRILNCGNGPGGTRPGGSATGAWSTCGGIVFEVIKEHEIVTVTASNWGGTALNPATTMTIDLTQYSWGHQFINTVRYGYLALSQASSYYELLEFEARNVPTKNTFQADVQLSKDPNNELLIYSDGLFSPKFNISKAAGNSIEKKDDGYYVCAAVSKKEDNALQKIDDGLYVRKFENIKTVTQRGHGFSVGDFIFYHPTDAYQKALGIDDYDINIVGIVSKVINADTFEYQWSGFFKTNLFNTVNGFIQGMPVYISDVDRGKVVQSQPDISKAVGYPVEDVGIIISIERGIQYNQEASMGDFKTSANTYNIRSDGFIRVVDGVEYKQTIAQRLLEALDDTFKSNYMVFDDANGTFQFINSEVLLSDNGVTEGLNLFIKAF